VHLQRATELEDLSPIHRLDRETAGLLLFSIRPDTRAVYHGLFSERQVEREYVAASYVRDPLRESRWRIENRLGQGEPWFRQRIVDGKANSVTDIEVIRIHADVGEFRLLPKTGRKHQLRVHMASIGYPIIGDPFYPTIRPRLHSGTPMQLVARRLKFADPLTGCCHEFTSKRTLSYWEVATGCS
jgi:tRNA pseudouridine32 synthase/23S rRNA pseudouridine746 synthase